MILTDRTPRLKWQTESHPGCSVLQFGSVLQFCGVNRTDSECPDTVRRDYATLTAGFRLPDHNEVFHYAALAI